MAQHNPVPSTGVRTTLSPSPAATIRRIEPSEAPQIGSPLQRLLQLSGESVQTCHIWGGFSPTGKAELVVLLVPQVGRTALLLTHTSIHRRQIDALAAVLRAACDHVPAEQAVLVQALLPVLRQPLHEAFAQAGFEPLATLQYMQAHVSERTDPPVLPPHVTLESYQPSRHAAFIEALEASYRHTMDCPGLCGLRQTEDVIRGHMATGQFNPALWTLMRVEGRPAGVLLLNPIPEVQCIELVYLGIDRHYRRRGLGTLLMQHAMAQCAVQGVHQFTLAADENNTAALALYQRFGLRKTARKQVLIRPLGTSRPPRGSA